MESSHLVVVVECQDFLLSKDSLCCFLSLGRGGPLSVSLVSLCQVEYQLPTGVQHYWITLNVRVPYGAYDKRYPILRVLRVFVLYYGSWNTVPVYNNVNIHTDWYSRVLTVHFFLITVVGAAKILQYLVLQYKSTRG